MSMRRDEGDATRRGGGERRAVRRSDSATAMPLAWLVTAASRRGAHGPSGFPVFPILALLFLVAFLLMAPAGAGAVSPGPPTPSAASVWFADGKSLKQVNTETGKVDSTVALAEPPRAVAADPMDGSVFAVVGERLNKYDASGKHVVEKTDLKLLTRGGRRQVSLAVGPHDGMVWLAGVGEVVRLSPDRKVLGTTKLGRGEDVRALVTSQDGGAWILGRRALYRVSPAGDVLSRRGVPASTGTAKHLALDEIGGFAYVAGDEAFVRFGTGDEKRPAKPVRPGSPIEGGIAVNPFDGKLYAGSSKALYAYDRSGKQLPSRNLKSYKIGKPNDISFDAVSGGLWLGGDKALVWVVDGKQTRLPIKRLSALAAAPVRLSSRLSMSQPLDQTEVKPDQPVRLRVEALCNGVPCPGGELPGYFEKLRLEATLGGKTVGEQFEIERDAAGYEAAYAPEGGLPEGEHAFAAAATDPFGNRSNEVTANLVVKEEPAPPQEGIPPDAPEQQPNAPENADPAADPAPDTEPNPNQLAQKREEREASADGGVIRPMAVDPAVGAVVQNDLVKLGVNKTGELNVEAGDPSSGTGTTKVGIRYKPTNADAVSPGCLCEGWGVADATSLVTGYANQALGSGGLSVESFTSDASTATSVVKAGGTFRVTHEYAPAPETPNLYKVNVKIENVSAAETDVRYRRVMDWDVEPTAFSEYVTINTGEASGKIAFASNDGFASADPLSGPRDRGVVGDATDSGPQDHGALFDFNFGRLAPAGSSGDSLSFSIYYGAGKDQTEAETALQQVGAQAYSLGKPRAADGLAGDGTPNTFAFGFGGLGSVPPVDPEDYDRQDDHGECYDSNACGQDPINFVTGNMYEAREDLNVPGKGFPLQFARYYNSQDTYSGPLGFGWTHNLNTQLTEESDGTVTELDPQGRRLRFARNPDGSYSAPKGVHDDLTRASDGSYKLKKKDGVEWLFGADGRLQKIADPDGNAVGLSYGADGKLTKVTDAVGREALLRYNSAGRIETLTDPAGNVTRYGYVAGALVSVTDPMGYAIRYEYDAKRNMVRIREKNGASATFEYDGDDRVMHASGGGGADETTLAYDEANNKTTVTDSRGKKTTVHYNGMSRIIKLVRPDLAELDFGWDANGNRTSHTNGRTEASSTTYDAKGNPTEVVAPGGATAKRTYDAFGNVTSHTDAVGKEWRYSYDGRGNLLEATDALGNRSAYEYDASGQLLKETRPNGSTNPDGTPGTSSTMYAYDVAGNVIEQTDALGNKTTYAYDALGHATSQTDAQNRVTQFVYDPMGRPTETRNPDGTSRYYLYDANGNPTRNCDENRRCSYIDYDAQNRPVRETNALGNSTSFEYDTEGLLVSETDALGRKTTHEYDAMGRLVKTNVPDGTTNPDGAPGVASTAYGYDAAGNLAEQTDPLGRTTKMTYDALGRLTKLTDPKGGTATQEYDALGRTTGITNPNGHATSYAYDARGRMVEEKDALGNVTAYGYDAVGNATSRIDAERRKTTYAYDAINRLVSTVYPDGSERETTYDAAGNNTSVTDKSGKISFEYDVRGLRVKEKLPDGRTVGNEYDKVGNRIALVYPDGKKVRYGYDDAGRPTSVTDPGGVKTAYAYDALGLNTKVTYPGGATESFAYDPLGRTTSVTDAAADGAVLAKLSYEYDGANNPTLVTDEAGKNSTFVYDELNRLLEEAHPEAAISYAYDAVGNRTSTTKTPTGKAATTTTYAYDAAERMTRAGGASFGYDKMGNMTSKTMGRNATKYVYDFEGRMTGAGNVGFRRDALGRVSSTERLVLSSPTAEPLPAAEPKGFVYDGDRVVREKDQAGNLTDYVRDSGGQLVSRKAGSSASSYYLRDPIGSTTGLTDGAGALTDTYSYDAFGNPLSRTGSTPNPFGYAGNASVPGSGLSDFQARAYDPATGRFASQDPIEGVADMPQSLNPYSYGWNNPLAHPDPTGQCPPCVVLGLGALTAAEVVYIVGLSAVGACAVSADCQEGVKEVLTEGADAIAGAIQEFQETKPVPAAPPAPAPSSGSAEEPSPRPEPRPTPPPLPDPAPGCEVPTLCETAKPGAPFAGTITGGGSGGGDDDWAEISGMLRAAARGKGDFGIGSATRTKAEELGKAWVGKGYKVASDGKTLISKDGLRQYRPPTLKPRLGKVQANLERRYVAEGRWQSNAHVDVTP